MANKVSILDAVASGATISGLTIGSLYSYSLGGGNLQDVNKVRLQLQALGNFTTGATLAVYAYYAGLTLASISMAGSVTTTNVGTFFELYLSGGGSVNTQYGVLTAYTGLPIGELSGSLTGFGLINGNSGGDETLELKAVFSDGASIIVRKGATLELLAVADEQEIPSLSEPTAYIWSNSKLNKVHHSLRKNVTFYAPLEHNLTFLGVGTYSFVRAGTTTALWRDGAYHTVAANKPRFEYNGDIPLGLAISTLSETLGFHTGNKLDDANTLTWLEDGSYKYTPVDSNPFSAGGFFTGATTSNVHISQITKYGRVLSASEIDLDRIGKTS